MEEAPVSHDTTLIDIMSNRFHSVIKFWSRKDPRLILGYVDKGKLLIDPFSGSGSSGFVAVFKNMSAYLSDINPVSVFIGYNILNTGTIERSVIEHMVRICREAEKEAYMLNSSTKVKYAIWKTYIKCPHCKKYLKTSPLPIVKCKGCGAEVPLRNAIRIDKVIALVLEDGRIIDQKEDIKRYLEIEESLEPKWYPKGTFIYPETGVEFIDGPHRHMEIKDLFTKRNLYVVSTIYHHIEKIWKEDPTQGDFLKLSFIASLPNATKMMPHAESSGPSWKLPRYWVPSLREERNFCATFIRKLLLLSSFKNMWKKVCKHKVTVSYRDDIVQYKEGTNMIYIFVSDANEAWQLVPEPDIVILDPPHYDEINYFEMTYLWQKWLEGSYGDARFSDYEFWKNEININKRLGKTLDWYNYKLAKLASGYASRLKRGGKLILILHNKDIEILRSTIQTIEQNLEGIFTKQEYLVPTAPSSAQGLHRRKKYLLIMNIVKK